jgi:lipopolysaccharide export system permease protein
MAREGHLEVWEGMWLSTFVLLPLGIFFTYKAVNDSAVFNRDAYVNFFRQLLGRSEARQLELKEVIMDEVELSVAFDKIERVSQHCRQFIDRYKKPQSYVDYWLNGFDRRELLSISSELEHMVDYMANSRNRIIILKLMELPRLRQLWFYYPTNVKPLSWAFIVIFPVGIPLFLIGRSFQRKLKEELEHIITTDNELIGLLKVKTEDINI